MNQSGEGERRIVSPGTGQAKLTAWAARYDMQEEKLSLALENVYGLPRGTLSTWHASTHSGCLGKELKQLLQRKHWRPRDVGQAMTFGR